MDTMLRRGPLDLPPPHPPSHLPSPPQLAEKHAVQAFAEPRLAMESSSNRRMNPMSVGEVEESKDEQGLNTAPHNFLSEITALRKNGIKLNKVDTNSQPKSGQFIDLFPDGIPPPPPPPSVNDPHSNNTSTLIVPEATMLPSDKFPPRIEHDDAFGDNAESEVDDEEWSDDDSEVVQLRKRVELLEDKLASANRSITHLKAVESKLTDALESAEENVKKEMTTTLEEERTKHNTQVTRLMNEVEELRARETRDKELIQSLKREVSSVEKRRTEIASESTGRQREIQRIREDMVKLNSQSAQQQSELKVLRNAQTQLEETTSTLKARDIQVAQLTNQVEVLKQHHLAALQLVVRASSDAVKLKKSQLRIREAQEAKKQAALEREHNRHGRMLARAALPKFATVGASSSSSTGKFNAISLGLTSHMPTPSDSYTGDGKRATRIRVTRKSMYPQYEISAPGSEQRLRMGLQ